ncbi:glutamate synthase [Chloroflexota bacterium]
MQKRGGSMNNNRRNIIIDRIIGSRAELPHSDISGVKAAEEGGCGVTGFIASIPVSGRHIYEPSVQMHNRGNGKGGGIAAVGLTPEGLGVSRQVLDSHYLLQIALLDDSCYPELEASCITPYLDVHKAERIPTLDDYRQVKGLEVKPPDVWRYFVRVKKDILESFIEKKGLQDMDARQAEDEFIYQNSYHINQQFYASLGEKQAFVLSHGCNIMVLKLVGYAEHITQYYLLEDFKAHGWIAHQRYPTKGRVWHPGGAHPFSGMHEALVHNGDFANYHTLSEYLKQHNIYPQFLTDTEVSVQLFDLWSRTQKYPLEYVIEAMAPTSEYDFELLPPEKQHIYRRIQSLHTNTSPDGPWFFIIARNDISNDNLQLIGITDTAMLRPQVFALQDGEVQIGLICSEKQAIDATLQSLAVEDSRFCPIADKYWNCRGGSSSDGGAFIFNVEDAGRGDGSKRLVCTNKFGQAVELPANQKHLNIKTDLNNTVDISIPDDGPMEYYSCNLKNWDYAVLNNFCCQLVKQAAGSDAGRKAAIKTLTWLNDRRLDTGGKKRSSVLQVVRGSLADIFGGCPNLNKNSESAHRYIDWSLRSSLRAPNEGEEVLVLNAKQFPPEGDYGDARLICAAYELGWRRFICYGYKGQRFCGCGLGKETKGVRIDVYDSSGDYLASGIDGLEMTVHGNAQDQVGQIMNRGKLVIYGDVGQTFMYGAKGGKVFIMGNAAGRPLINAGGKPRVVINGTCLDYLAESFMAGNPLKGGGFVIMNGIQFDRESRVIDKPTPYPGSNLFSLASGGAIYLRDPYKRVVEEQLNGGHFFELKPSDWEVILPYLQENERLFGVSVEDDLLTVDGVKKDYAEVYRKVGAVRLDVLKRVEMDSED